MPITNFNTKMPVPTEDAECFVLAEYLQLKGYLFGHINNEFYTKSWKQKNRQIRMGTAKGFPDYAIIAKGQFICIEMKRIKGSVTSPHQKAWLSALNDAGVKAYVCNGADEAIAILEGLR